MYFASLLSYLKTSLFVFTYKSTELSAESVYPLKTATASGQEELLHILLATKILVSLPDNTVKNLTFGLTRQRNQKIK
jgi:hypothetical protein